MAHHIPFLSDLSAQHQLKQRLIPVGPKAVERRHGSKVSAGSTDHLLLGPRVPINSYAV